MRLTKVQKALKAKDIEYSYKEEKGCGQIDFIFNDKLYMVHEVTGNRGNTPIGLYTNFFKRLGFNNFT